MQQGGSKSREVDAGLGGKHGQARTLERQLVCEASPVRYLLQAIYTGPHLHLLPAHLRLTVSNPNRSSLTHRSSQPARYHCSNLGVITSLEIQYSCIPYISPHFNDSVTCWKSWLFFQNVLQKNFELLLDWNFYCSVGSKYVAWIIISCIPSLCANPILSCGPWALLEILISQWSDKRGGK